MSQKLVLETIQGTYERYNQQQTMKVMNGKELENFTFKSLIRDMLHSSLLLHNITVYGPFQVVKYYPIGLDPIKMNRNCRHTFCTMGMSYFTYSHHLFFIFVRAVCLQVCQKY